MTTPLEERYAVGGVQLPRPFRTRRLGHVGINVESPERSAEFYARLFGFRISDTLDFRFIIGPERAAALGASVGYFMRHGTEHHSWVLFPAKAWAAMSGLPEKHPEIATNQITWQVGSLREVTEGHDWLAQRRPILRSGRDTPGSNWNVYPVDPEGHVNELYYGIEQIGWQGTSKPRELHQIRYMELPALPHRSEYAEVMAARAAGLDLESGTRMEEPEEERYDVGGVLLGRPFKVTKIGPIRLFVNDLDAALPFYVNDLGLVLSETVEWHGHRCAFLRTNTEHHSLALYPIALRDELGLPAGSTLFSMGFQLGDYRQLRAAVAYLAEHGLQAQYFPPEFFPGMDYCAFVRDPDGRLIQLYAYMEQIGWDGRTKPPAARRKIDNAAWPDVIEPESDTFYGEAYLGPWG
jgi:catechol 2,3-dioxygenase-like lactoylglutathione lyase family enzyme